MAELLAKHWSWNHLQSEGPELNAPPWPLAGFVIIE